ncbi:hypothetical protein Tco_0481337 [Tanacetum coccineum]
MNCSEGLTFGSLKACAILALLLKWRWRLLYSSKRPLGSRHLKLIMGQEGGCDTMVVASRAFWANIREMDIPTAPCPSLHANVESANHIFLRYASIVSDMMEKASFLRWVIFLLFKLLAWGFFHMNWTISWLNVI